MEHKFVSSLGNRAVDCVCERRRGVLTVKKDVWIYENLMIEVVFFETDDVVAGSPEDGADDLGGWHNEWFSQNQGA